MYSIMQAITECYINIILFIVVIIILTKWLTLSQLSSVQTAWCLVLCGGLLLAGGTTLNIHDGCGLLLIII